MADLGAASPRPAPGRPAALARFDAIPPARFDASVLDLLPDGTRFLLLSFGQSRYQLSHMLSRRDRAGALQLEGLLRRQTPVDLLLDGPSDCPAPFCCRIWAGTANEDHRFRCFIETHLLKCPLVPSDWHVIQKDWRRSIDHWGPHCTELVSVDLSGLVHVPGSELFTDAHMKRINEHFDSLPELASCRVVLVGRGQRGLKILLNNAAMRGIKAPGVATTIDAAIRMLELPEVAGTKLVLVEGELVACSSLFERLCAGLQPPGRRVLRSRTPATCCDRSTVPPHVYQLLRLPSHFGTPIFRSAISSATLASALKVLDSEELAPDSLVRFLRQYPAEARAAALLPIALSIPAEGVEVMAVVLREFVTNVWPKAAGNDNDALWAVASMKWLVAMRQSTDQAIEPWSDQAIVSSKVEFAAAVVRFAASRAPEYVEHLRAGGLLKYARAVVVHAGPPSTSAAPPQPLLAAATAASATPTAAASSSVDAGGSAPQPLAQQRIAQRRTERRRRRRQRVTAADARDGVAQTSGADLGPQEVEAGDTRGGPHEADDDETGNEPQEADDDECSGRPEASDGDVYSGPQDAPPAPSSQLQQPQPPQPPQQPEPYQPDGSSEPVSSQWLAAALVSARAGVAGARQALAAAQRTLDALEAAQAHLEAARAAHASAAHEIESAVAAAAAATAAVAALDAATARRRATVNAVRSEDDRRIDAGDLELAPGDPLWDAKKEACDAWLRAGGLEPDALRSRSAAAAAHVASARERLDGTGAGLAGAHAAVAAALSVDGGAACSWARS